jgi:hypothetical protein
LKDGVVDRDTFEERLRTAALRAVQVAREFVWQSLPDATAFLVVPNASFDGNPRVGDEAVFPEESLPEGEYHGPLPAADAIEFLWRSGKVPEWIDVSVVAEDGLRTLVELRCCGRFTESEDLLYHRSGGVPPFSIKSPMLPPRWEGVESSGRFDLYWQSCHNARPRTDPAGGKKPAPDGNE